MQNSISLVEFKISKLEKQVNGNDLDSKVKFLTGAADVIAKIENSIERQLYIDKIARKYNIGSGTILNEVEKRIKKVEGSEVVIDVQAISRKMQLVTNIRKRQEQFIIALLLCKDKKIQQKIFEKISVDDIFDEDVKKVYEFILNLSKTIDINKIDILTKVQDDEMMKEITEIMYIDVSEDREKLLNDVLKNKNKEKLLLRREEILKRLAEDITIDEKQILKLELNQVILELSKLK